LSFFGNYIKLLINQESYQTINKLFKIFIELTQNISYYSAESKEVGDGNSVGVGEFSLKDYEDHFLFTTGNLVQHNDGKKLINHCNEINALNLEELRILKREKRKQSTVIDVGAHIGLIQVGLLSSNKYDFTISEIDKEFSYFNLSVRINKE
jgi:hypothetical protein